MQYAKNISRKRFFLITYCFVILNGNKNKTNKKSLHCQNIAAVSLHANNLKKKSPLSVCYKKSFPVSLKIKCTEAFLMSF